VPEVIVVKVILSADGEDETRAGRDWCLANLDNSSSVVVVQGINLLSDFVAGLPMFDLMLSIDDVVARTERDICEPLSAGGVPCRARVMTTGQTQALIEAAEEEHADLIVLGKVPHGRWADAIRGETAAHLVHRPPCAVLIVPTEAESETVHGGATPQRRAVP
jgi:nucleotide-binding universal stress UspA family protein